MASKIKRKTRAAKSKPKRRKRWTIMGRAAFKAPINSRDLLPPIPSPV